jgi:hypothetical protein
LADVQVVAVASVQTRQLAELQAVHVVVCAAVAVAATVVKKYPELHAVHEPAPEFEQVAQFESAQVTAL